MRCRRFVAGLVAVFAAVAVPGVVAAQHEGHAMPADSSSAEPARGPLGIPDTRMGSGTAWLPDASPMHAIHARAGGWMLMLQGIRIAVAAAGARWFLKAFQAIIRI